MHLGLLWCHGTETKQSQELFDVLRVLPEMVMLHTIRATLASGKFHGLRSFCCKHFLLDAVTSNKRFPHRWKYIDARGSSCCSFDCAKRHGHRNHACMLEKQ